MSTKVESKCDTLMTKLKRSAAAVLLSSAILGASIALPIEVQSSPQLTHNEIVRIISPSKPKGMPFDEFKKELAPYSKYVYETYLNRKTGRIEPPALWNKEILYNIDGLGDEPVQLWYDHVMQQLAAVTGLSIRRADREAGDKVNFEILFHIDPISVLHEEQVRKNIEFVHGDYEGFLSLVRKNISQDNNWFDLNINKTNANGHQSAFEFILVSGVDNPTTRGKLKAQLLFWTYRALSIPSGNLSSVTMPSIAYSDFSKRNYNVLPIIDEALLYSLYHMEESGNMSEVEWMLRLATKMYEYAN